MKNIKMLFVLMITLTVVFGFSVRSHATLTIIGTAEYGGSDYNLIYDNHLNITWLDYSNPVDGWSNQRDWADGLNSGGGLSYTLNVGVTASWVGEDWRLPTTVDGSRDLSDDNSTMAGHNVTSSELGHLFYTELGNQGVHDTAGNDVNFTLWGLLNPGDFVNLENSTYWSGTPYGGNPSAVAWTFGFSQGLQGTATMGGQNFYGLAVLPGDVSLLTATEPPTGSNPVVPEPSTYLLLGSGIAGLIVWRRKSL